MIGGPLLLGLTTGVTWLQAEAWAAAPTAAGKGAAGRPNFYAMGALLVLPLIFQCVLRPGIRFY